MIKEEFKKNYMTLTSKQKNILIGAGSVLAIVMIWGAYNSSRQKKMVEAVKQKELADVKQKEVAEFENADPVIVTIDHAEIIKEPVESDFDSKGVIK